jgi:hypothetical protein
MPSVVSYSMKNVAWGGSVSPEYSSGTAKLMLTKYLPVFPSFLQPVELLAPSYGPGVSCSTR